MGAGITTHWRLHAESHRLAAEDVNLRPEGLDVTSWRHRSVRLHINMLLLLGIEPHPTPSLSDLLHSQYDQNMTGSVSDEGAEEDVQQLNEAKRQTHGEDGASENGSK